METQLAQHARRITTSLFVAQSLFSGSMIAIATVATIIGAELSGDRSLAGVPSTVLQLAAAPAAYVMGLLWDRVGRRRGLSLGLVFGFLGVLLSLIAVLNRSFPLFLAGLAGLGIARASTQLSRFIAGEVNPPGRRGSAISLVVWGGTIGAVGGPLLVAPSGIWAASLGMDELAGPFLASLVIFVLGVAVIWLGLRPDPLEISRQIEQEEEEKNPSPSQTSREARPLGRLLAQPGVFVAMAAMVISQAVMVMVMGITALHMADHSHPLGSISLVFSAHTLGMFAFSILTGRLADRWGRVEVIIAGAIMLMISFAVAPLSPQLFPLAFALFTLGLGWNFCFVAGSALLADQLSPAERSRTQGFNDLLISLVTALGSFTSGLIFAANGYGPLNFVTAALTLAMLALVVWWYAAGQGREPVAA